MTGGKVTIAVAAIALCVPAILFALTTPTNSAVAASNVPVFGHTVDLGRAGGEPSIQDDGQGRLYITTPQGLGSTTSGVLLTRSVDSGQTFLPNQVVGGVVGGGDSDVLTDVFRQNTWIADLGAVFTSVLHSTDQGATFPNQTQAGPEDDREWLTSIGPNLYLVYHDFALGVPLVFVSTDHGATFTPKGTAGQIIAPGDPGFNDAKCSTLVSKPVSDVQGNLYVLINTSTAQEAVIAGQCAGIPPLDRFYFSVSHDGGATWSTHLINDISSGATGKATSGSWGHVFNQLAIDNGGNLYINASGTLDGNQPLQNYLLVSKDHGMTWSQPFATNASANGQLFPSIAVGQSGQVAVGYYQGTKPDHHATGNNFQFIVDQTLNATDPSPTWTHTQLAPLKGATPHPDGICTDGILCGTPASSGGNRNLADFESMAVDPTGNLEVIIPADCNTCTGTENWFYKQTDGPLMSPGPTNGNGTGNQTWVAGARTAPPPGPAAPPLVNTALPSTSVGIGTGGPLFGLPWVFAGLLALLAVRLLGDSCANFIATLSRRAARIPRR